MKLTTKERKALVQSIRGHVETSLMWAYPQIGGEERLTYASRMFGLAARLEMKTETARDDSALRFIPALSYTMPCIDSEATKDDHERLAFLLAAFYKCNNLSHRFETCTSEYAARQIMNYLSMS